MHHFIILNSERIRERDRKSDGCTATGTEWKGGREKAKIRRRERGEREKGRGKKRNLRIL